MSDPIPRCTYCGEPSAFTHVCVDRTAKPIPSYPMPDPMHPLQVVWQPRTITVNGELIYTPESSR